MSLNLSSGAGAIALGNAIKKNATVRFLCAAMV